MAEGWIQGPPFFLKAEEDARLEKDTSKEEKKHEHAQLKLE